MRLSATKVQVPNETEVAIQEKNLSQETEVAIQEHKLSYHMEFWSYTQLV